MKTIGVVIPVYNVEKYLDECLISFVNQTSKDFHIYLIDDGSTDKSGQIARSYVDKYPELFEYHYQENSGQGKARNYALSILKERYVWFFDSDDFTGAKTIENIIKEINKSNYDAYLFTPVIFNMVNGEYWDWHDKCLVEDIFKTGNVVSIDNCKELMSLETSMCRFIIKKSLIDNAKIVFPEGVKWEDAFPRIKLVCEAKQIAYLDIVGAYYYRINSGKQTTSGNGKTRFDMYPVFNEIIDYAFNKNLDVVIMAHIFRIIQNYVIWSLHVIEKDYRKKYVKLMHEIYRRISLRIIRNYRDLPMPYKPSRENVVIGFIVRSRCFYNFLARERTFTIFKKIYDKLRRVKHFLRK